MRFACSPAAPTRRAVRVSYLSEDPLTCAAALFQCEAGQTTFNDACGCGCPD
jgi:hypothetical protein